MPGNRLQGIAAAPGIAIGPIFRLATTRLQAQAQTVQDTQHELIRLDEALAQAHAGLQTLFTRAQDATTGTAADIFEAHELFLDDPELLSQVRHTITAQQMNAAYAWQEATTQYATQLRQLNDEYLAARALDIEDVAQRVLRILLGETTQQWQISQPSIIVAEELTPSETIQLERAKIRAFCIARGGPTSHVAILAKALGLPAITGLPDLEQLCNGQLAIVDGDQGLLYIEPDMETLTGYQRQASTQQNAREQAQQSAHLDAHTLDGTRIEVVANIGSPEQVSDALQDGAEGVGLLRTEFLFMDRATPPEEDEQESIYSTIFQDLTPARPIVVRTFDIGGDKPLAYLDMPAEENPFLGERGIRLALAQPALLQTQLRALLKAGQGYSLKIMFPMVASKEELEAIQKQVALARASLTEQGFAHAQKVELGIMIEVPSAALLADVLAPHVDFFSVGTNDLTQYTLAADRGNARVAQLADALHPAVLRLIHMVTSAAHKHGKWVGLCGELAGDPLATPVLLGLGLDELSMTSRSIPLVKNEIRKTNLQEAHQIAAKALSLGNAVEVRAYLKALTEQPV